MAQWFLDIEQYADGADVSSIFSIVTADGTPVFTKRTDGNGRAYIEIVTNGRMMADVQDGTQTDVIGGASPRNIRMGLLCESGNTAGANGFYVTSFSGGFDINDYPVYAIDFEADVGLYSADRGRTTFTFQKVGRVAANENIIHYIERASNGDSYVWNTFDPAGRPATPWTTGSAFVHDGSERLGICFGFSRTWRLYHYAMGTNGDPAPTEALTVLTNAFVTQWQTDNAGVTGANQITLPLVSSGTYDFTVNWGDGSTDQITSFDQAEVTHTYPSAGSYAVEMAGTISGWQFNNGGDKQKITQISQWGDLAFGINDRHFYGCTNLAITATDAPDLSGIDRFRWTFAFCTSIGTADLNAWDVSAFDDFFRMFYFSNFDGLIGAWNVSTMRNAQSMFQGAPFNGDITGWDVSALVFAEDMFNGASSFNQPLGSWNTLILRRVSRMFASATSFDQDLSAWDLSAIERLDDVFADSGISQANYNAVLDIDTGWLSSEPLGSDVPFTNTPAQYSPGGAAEAGRDRLITVYGWTITDQGPSDGYQVQYTGAGAVHGTEINPDGVAFEVRLLRLDGTAAPISVDLTDSGVTKRYRMDDYVANAEVRVTLDDYVPGSGEAGIYQALSTARDKEWRLELDIDGALDWQGFVVPRRVTKDLSRAGKRIVTVLAKSRLGDLAGGTIMASTTGTEDMASILRRLLREYARANVVAATSWYPFDGVAMLDEPLARLLIERRTFTDEEGETITDDVVLEQTHKRLGARLVQSEGKWQVYQEAHLTQGNVDVTEIDANGNETVTTENRVVNLESDGRLIESGSSAIGSLGQLRRQSVRYSHGTIGQELLSNLSFFRTPQAASGDGSFNWRPADTQGHEYITSANAVRAEIITNNGLPSSAPTRYWQQFGGQVVGGPERQMAFGFDASIVEGAQTITGIGPKRVYYVLKVGSAWWNEGARVWQTTQALNPRDFAVGQSDMSLDIVTTALTLSGSPVSGLLEVRLYGGWEDTPDQRANGSAEYRSVTIQLLTPNSEGELTDPEARLTTVQEIDTLGTEDGGEVNFIVGDGPTTAHDARLRYIGGTGTVQPLTQNWALQPHSNATGISLDRLWAVEQLKRRRTAAERRRVRISSRGKVLSPARIYAWDGKLWSWEQWTYSAAGGEQSYDITLVEEKSDPVTFDVAFAQEDLKQASTQGTRRAATAVVFSPIQAVPQKLGVTIKNPTGVGATQWVVPAFGADLEFEAPIITGQAETADAATYDVQIGGVSVGSVDVSSAGAVTTTVVSGTAFGSAQTLQLVGPGAAADVTYLALVLHLRRA